MSSPTPQFESLNSSILGLLYDPTLTFIHDYWKIMALISWTFVLKVMSLLFNTLYWFVIAFLPNRKHLLISWLQSPSTVILEISAYQTVHLVAFSFFLQKKAMPRRINKYSK